VKKQYHVLVTKTCSYFRSQHDSKSALFASRADTYVCGNDTVRIYLEVLDKFTSVHKNLNRTHIREISLLTCDSRALRSIPAHGSFAPKARNGKESTRR